MAVYRGQTLSIVPAINVAAISVNVRMDHLQKIKWTPERGAKWFRALHRLVGLVELELEVLDCFDSTLAEDPERWDGQS